MKGGRQVARSGIVFGYILILDEEERNGREIEGRRKVCKAFMGSDEEILLYERRVKLREAETREEGII